MLQIPLVLLVLVSLKCCFVISFRSFQIFHAMEGLCSMNPAFLGTSIDIYQLRPTRQLAQMGSANGPFFNPF